MTVEQRLEQLEKRIKRLTVALTMTVVAMAAAGEKFSHFDTVVARTVFVTNDAGDIVVSLHANDGGDGLVRTKSAKGKDLVDLTSIPDGKGTVKTYQPNGKALVKLGATADGNGGMVSVYNKTGESIVQMYADEYGNGVVGAWNRKGKGRTLQPGP